MTKSELTNLIVESNLPFDAKMLVLSGISTEHRNWEARKKYEKMMSSLILGELSKTEGKRMKDIAAAIGDDFSVQRLNIIMKDLLLKRKVYREVVETGRTLVVKYEHFNYTTYKYEWTTKEIPETYAVFTLA
jgi:hypothetical protein